METMYLDERARCDALVAALETAKPLLEKYDDICRRLARDKREWLNASTYVAKGFVVARAIEQADAALNAATQPPAPDGASAAQGDPDVHRGTKE